MSELIFTDVCFAFGEKVILDRFSLTLPLEGVTALAGPSGCGKTTLLRLIAALEAPDSGKIDAPKPEQIALLFQENRLLPGLSAKKQVKLVLPRGQDALPWLEAVGLGHEADTPPEQLSGGMQRRVALARCMAYGQDKHLLLLDEPFTGIDPARAKDLMGRLRKMRVPVIFSAHDAESLALADRVIRFDGSPIQTK